VGGSGVDVCTSACAGGGAGQLNLPSGVAVSGGEVYVADTSNNRVAEFGPTNAPPVALADAYSTNEDTALTVGAPASGVLGNDPDGDNDPLTAVGYTDPQHGTLSHNADGTFSYTPDSNFNGRRHRRRARRSRSNGHLRQLEELEHRDPRRSMDGRHRLGHPDRRTSRPGASRPSVADAAHRGTANGMSSSWTPGGSRALRRPCVRTRMLEA
jgi:hypothetical protein